MSSELSTSHELSVGEALKLHKMMQLKIYLQDGIVISSHCSTLQDVINIVRKEFDLDNFANETPENLERICSKISLTTKNEHGKTVEYQSPCFAHNFGNIAEIIKIHLFPRIVAIEHFRS